MDTAINSLTNDIYVGRQPIFDQNMKVFGYELLFRSGDHAQANVVDGNQATSQVIINTFLEIGLENISNNCFTFINLTSDFLTGEIPLPLQPDKVVLEILEDIELNDNVVSSIKNLSAQGFTIALDDFVLNEKNQVLLPLANIIKVDPMVLTEDKLRRQVQIFKRFDLKLLAEKVETIEEYEMCKELGFEYFQGYYFSKPRVIRGKQLSANRLTLLDMVAKLQSPDCNMHELEPIISRDVAISYKLLRIVNSPFYGLSSKIESIKHALVIIGLKALKSWIIVAGLSQIDDKPTELLNITLIRAKMCEQLASKFGCDIDSAYMTGLFSILDVVMDLPFSELLKQLPLDENISLALTEQSGSLGELLKLVIAYEQGDWPSVDASQISGDTIRQIYLGSLNWSSEISSQMDQAGSK